MDELMEYNIRDGERTVVCYSPQYSEYHGHYYIKSHEDSFIRVRKSLKRRFEVGKGVFYSTDCKTPETYLFFKFLKKERF